MKLLKLLLRVIFIPVSIFLCLTGYAIFQDRISTGLKMSVPDRQKTLKDPSEYTHPLQAPGSEKINIRNTWELKHKPFDTKKGIPTIFAITPTYYRLEQKADLTRLCQTLRLVENLHWILVEDSLNKTELVKRLLNNCKVRCVHLNAVTPPRYKNIPGRKKFPRGVAQRNAALTWIREHVNPKETQGVVYFADDDNTYDVRIFEEMRYTNIVSVWPVGLIAGGKFESPIVKDGKVVGWIFLLGTHRRFPIDMASFAFNVQLLFTHPEAEFNFTAQAGTQESTILQGLNVTMSDMEPKANNCTEILVWHTRTQGTSLVNQLKLQQKFKTVNFDLEV